MNGRRLYREYALYKGRDAQQFVEVTSDWNDHCFIYLDSEGVRGSMYIEHKDMVNWIIRKCKVELK